MRLERYLEEEWVTKVKGFGNSVVDVFVNPDKSDMFEISQLGKYCRFIADNKNKKLYVWGWDKAVHGTVATSIFGDWDRFQKSDERYMYGTAEKKGIKWKVLDAYDSDIPMATLKKLYNWMYKYIDMKGYRGS